MVIRIIQPGTGAYDEMVNLRLKVLLDPIGIPRSYINAEKDKEDILIGAFADDKLTGCCILTHIDSGTLQLRQMAVDNEVQKKGIGAAIISFAESVAMEKGYRILMMHARDTVVDFYRKCGYHTSSEQFFEVGIGHHKMEKQLAPA